MEKKCDSCHVGMPLLKQEQIQQELQDLPGWCYDAKLRALYKCFTFKGFYKTMAFVNAVAWVAHQQGHHPDLQVQYAQVTVYFTTHEAGGVTTNDPLCAQAVEAL